MRVYVRVRALTRRCQIRAMDDNSSSPTPNARGQCPNAKHHAASPITTPRCAFTCNASFTPERSTQALVQPRVHYHQPPHPLIAHMVPLPWGAPRMGWAGRDDDHDGQKCLRPRCTYCLTNSPAQGRPGHRSLLVRSPGCKRHSIREAIDHGSGEGPSIAILARGS